MIIKTQEATFARLVHDEVTYQAKELGEQGNEIQITFSGSESYTGMSLSLLNKVVTINYQIINDIVTPEYKTLVDYTCHDVKDAYNHASQDIKDLIDISVSDQHHALQTEITAYLAGGQDEGENVLSRGVYAGMTEAELLSLRTQLRTALTDATTGKQVISVSIAGKQVTKQLPAYNEIRQELIELNTALAKINPSRYGKPRRRFGMDHRLRRI